MKRILAAFSLTLVAVAGLFAGNGNTAIASNSRTYPGRHLSLTTSIINPQGNSATFVVDIANDGPALVDDVTLNGHLPFGLTALPLPASTNNYRGGVSFFRSDLVSVGMLKPGEHRRFAVAPHAAGNRQMVPIRQIRASH